MFHLTAPVSIAPDSLDGVCRDRECEVEHCQSCTRRHVLGTVACKHCLNAAAVDLDDVLDMAARLRAEAFDGANRFGRPLAGQRDPGGMALLLTLPYADPEAREFVVQSIADGRIDGDLDEVTETPLECIAGWAHRLRTVRDLYETDADGERVTIDGDAVVLYDNLQWASQQWVGFPALAADLHAQARSLRKVLGMDDGVAKSAVPCTDCSTLMDVRVGASQASDHLVCPRTACGASMPLSRGPGHVRHLVTTACDEVEAAWVHITDAARVIGRSEQTLHTWVRTGVVASRVGRGRRKEVAWVEVMEQDALRKTRNRKKTPKVSQVSKYSTALATVHPLPVSTTPPMGVTL